MAVNPPASALGEASAIVSGRARHYHVASFRGPLSLKTVVRGSAVWETGAGRFGIEPGAVLLLNDDEEYSLEIDSLQPVETFCLFFARGFVENAWRAAVTGSAELFDSAHEPPGHVFERVDHGVLCDLVAAARAAYIDGNDVEPWFARIAHRIVSAQHETASRVAQIPALRAGTREELRRRAGRAVEYMHSHADRPLRLEEIAGAACLSPFHFHRVFTALHGVTPHAYHSRLRLERARRLLGSGRTVVEAALESGFSSAASFSGLFRRTFGVSPGRFRKIGEDLAPPDR